MQIIYTDLRRTNQLIDSLVFRFNEILRIHFAERYVDFLR